MDEDGFTLVKGGRQAKKRKAEGSPQLHSPPGASTVSPTSTPARPQPSSIKNVIPVILSNVDPKFSTKVKLMSELKQFHPHIKVSNGPGKEKQQFPNHRRHPSRRSNPAKRKQNEGLFKPKRSRSVSQKAYQTSQPKKSLVIKGVPSEVSEQEFIDSWTSTKLTMPRLNDSSEKKMVES